LSFFLGVRIRLLGRRSVREHSRGCGTVDPGFFFFFFLPRGPLVLSPTWGCGWVQVFFFHRVRVAWTPGPNPCRLHSPLIRSFGAVPFAFFLLLVLHWPVLAALKDEVSCTDPFFGFFFFG